ncbi:MAG TPA: redoxin domain-containing protein [Aggregatilineaceae bacterium]|nr:redoxin domain-containing protein [Aggregatilineaceae bacterium]
MNDDAAVKPDNELPDWLQQAAGEQPSLASAPVKQRFSTFTITAVVLIVGLLAVIGYALYQRGLSQPESGPAPDFSLTVFESDQLDRSGEQLQLDDLKGNVIVLNFWASYCEPCKKEAAMLEAMWREYKPQGVVFLGVNTDDVENKARDYMARYNITYPNAPDLGERLENDYRITGIPETFIIDATGEITFHTEGEISDITLRREIEAALKG